MTRHDPLYLTDAELAKRIGIESRDAPSVFAVWEKSGFPQIDTMTGKRYWPAIRAWLDRRHGLAAQSPSPKPDGEERWTSQTTMHPASNAGSARAET